MFAPLLGKARYKGAFGGRASGKSTFFAEMMIELCVEHSGLRCLCVREVQKSLKDSAKKLLEDRIDALKVPGFKVLDDRIITPGNGHILFYGMKDHTADSVKSIEGVNVAWFEEAQTATETSLEVLGPTVRGTHKTFGDAELWYSWNPRHASDPIEQMLRGSVPPENAIVVKANYCDNPFYPEVLENDRLKDKKQKPDRYPHIWLGEYEPAAVGAIFNRTNIHENRREEAPEMGRIVVALDPAVSSESGANENGIVVAGKGEDGRGYVLDDFTTHGPPKKWAERALAAYDLYDADAIIAEVNQGGDMVEHTIKALRPGVRVIKVRATKGKHVRAEPISALYDLNKISHVGSFPDLEGQMCQVTAQGYEGEGSPDRCIAKGELVETINGPCPIEDISVGDMVLTRRGYRRVLASEQTSEFSAVYDVLLSNGSKFKATDNHPVWTREFGFTEVKDLCYGLSVLTVRENDSWLGSTSISTEYVSHDTRKARASLGVDIIMNKRARGGRSIDICGRRVTDLYQKDTTSTTKMETRSIMMSQTLSAFRRCSMLESMKECMTATLKQGVRVLLEASSRLQRRLISASLANSDPMPQSEGGIILNTDQRYAQCAALSTRQGTFKRVKLVQESASTRRANLGEGLMCGSVQCAKRVTRQGLAKREQKHAPVNVVRVCAAGTAKTYNLKVEGESEYYVNGTLVHNCDAMVWALTELFPKLIKRSRPNIQSMPTKANTRYSPYRRSKK